MWVANDRNAKNVSKSELVLMIIISRSAGPHDVMFSNGASGFS